MKKLLNKAKTFWNIPLRRKKLLARIFGLSIFQQYLRLIKSPKANSENLLRTISKEKFSSRDHQFVSDLAFAISLGEKYIPWPNRCRHQAWQAISILNKWEVPYSFSVGIKKSDSLQGHAWVKVGESFVSGKCKEEDFFVLSQFYSKNHVEKINKEFSSSVYS